MENIYLVVGIGNCTKYARPWTSFVGCKPSHNKSKQVTDYLRDAIKWGLKE